MWGSSRCLTASRHPLTPTRRRLMTQGVSSAALGAGTARSPRSRRPGPPRRACRSRAGSAVSRPSARTTSPARARRSSVRAAPDGSRACRSRRGSPAASPAPRRREPAPAATTSSAGSTCSRCPRKGCRGVAAWRAAGGRASDRRGRLGARTRARSASSLIVGTLTGRIASIINRRSTRSASERDETTPGSAAIPAAMHSPRGLEAPTCER